MWREPILICRSMCGLPQEDFPVYYLSVLIHRYVFTLRELLSGIVLCWGDHGERLVWGNDTEKEWVGWRGGRRGGCRAKGTVGGKRRLVEDGLGKWGHRCFCAYGKQSAEAALRGEIIVSFWRFCIRPWWDIYMTYFVDIEKHGLKRGYKGWSGDGDRGLTWM